MQAPLISSSGDLFAGGRHVAKAIILDNVESRWVGPAEELERPSKALSQAHFDYDIVSYDYVDGCTLYLGVGKSNACRGDSSAGKLRRVETMRDTYAGDTEFSLYESRIPTATKLRKCVLPNVVYFHRPIAPGGVDRGIS